MAEILTIGNATIASCPEFSDGRTTGYLQFYDERYRPPFPLTSVTVCGYIVEIWSESYTDAWKAGCIVGWLEGLIENSPETFLSLAVSEYMRQGAR